MSTGVTFAASTDILPGGTRLRMLRDRLLIRPLDWEPSTILTVIRSGRPLRGEVVSVGPGRLYRRYRNKAGGKRDYIETAHFIPTQVKVGDIVELGGIDVYDGQGYNFPQVTIGTETFLMCQEQDCAGVYDAVA